MNYEQMIKTLIDAHSDTIEIIGTPLREFVTENKDITFHLSTGDQQVPSIPKMQAELNKKIQFGDNTNGNFIEYTPTGSETNLSLFMPDCGTQNYELKNDALSEISSGYFFSNKYHTLKVFNDLEDGYYKLEVWSKNWLESQTGIINVYYNVFFQKGGSFIPSVYAGNVKISADDNDFSGATSNSSLNVIRYNNKLYFNLDFVSGSLDQVSRFYRLEKLNY